MKVPVAWAGSPQEWIRQAANAINTGLLPLTGGTLTGDLTIKEASPAIDLHESDGTTTHNVFRITKSGDNVYFQTKSNALAAVSDDYVMTVGATGATQHRWSIAGSGLLYLTTNGLGLGSAASSPDSALHIYKQTNNRSARFQRISTQYLDVEQTSSHNYIVSTGKSFKVGTSDALPVIFNMNGSEAAQIDTSGNVKVTGGGTLGYGTGSGSTVTQATNRTTGVTINAPSGAITLFSAAGSTSWQSFTVTNSKVAATDVVVVSQKSGTDLYEIHVTAVAAGSFRISFKTTGGTTTEQPVFNFAVITGATA